MIKKMRFLQLFNVKEHYAEKKPLKQTNKINLLYQREQQRLNLVIIQFENS